MLRSVAKATKAEFSALAHTWSDTAAVQALLAQNIRRTAAKANPAASLWLPNLSVFSQHEEDGILLLIFALIGFTDRTSVELGAGDGMECNTSNLIVNHGFTGLLCDGDSVNVRTARRFFHRCRRTCAWPPKIVAEWLTKGNVNRTVLDGGLKGRIDLLSIDIDGMDFWIWKELNVIEPRVVVIEFNHLWGATRSVTVPYSDDFRAVLTEHGSDYAGASLPAMVKLGREKGYRLVATNRIATNAFFLHESVSCEHLPEVYPEECFGHPRAIFGQEHRLPLVAHRPWESV